MIRKHINKLLKTAYHKFYLVSYDEKKLWDIYSPENCKYCTKVKTKKRLKDLLNSANFCYEIKETYTNHQKNFTVLVRKREISC